MVDDVEEAGVVRMIGLEPLALTHPALGVVEFGGEAVEALGPLADLFPQVAHLATRAGPSELAVGEFVVPVDERFDLAVGLFASGGERHDVVASIGRTGGEYAGESVLLGNEVLDGPEHDGLAGVDGEALVALAVERLLDDLDGIVGESEPWPAESPISAVRVRDRWFEIGPLEKAASPRSRSGKGARQDVGCQPGCQSG